VGIKDIDKNNKECKITLPSGIVTERGGGGEGRTTGGGGGGGDSAATAVAL
jgi:hypothetical protein